MGEGVLKLARLFPQYFQSPAARRQRRRAAGDCGRLNGWRHILTGKTLTHARQAGMGPLLKKDVWYNEG